MEAKWRWILVTAIAPIAWGSNYYVTRHFLPADSPLWGAVIRALPAGLLLLAVARQRPRGAWWWRSAVLGILNVGAFFVLIYLASQLLPTSVASTIMASSAAVLMLLAWPLLGERPGLFSLLGAAIGFTGVCVMLLGGGSAGPGGGIDPLGVAVSLGAMGLSSVGFILTKRWSRTADGAAPVSTLALTSWQLIAGGMLLLPFAAVSEGPPPQLDLPAVLAFAYVSLIATALAFVAWFTGLRHLPAGAVGLVGLLNPVTGVLLGTLLAGEAFGPLQASGTALVLGGVLLGQRRSRAVRDRISSPSAASSSRRT
ncbi:EamA family transporter [Herbiconiux sp.]|uniref:DMT family transporter n=1 Tax=Herbiconiux sp. TaxID=1871186 RepID=UPI0025C5E272|nr:EamA family transporter [Herbiconiux sp.]